MLASLNIPNGANNSSRSMRSIGSISHPRGSVIQMNKAEFLEKFHAKDECHLHNHHKPPSSPRNMHTPPVFGPGPINLTKVMCNVDKVKEYVQKKKARQKTFFALINDEHTNPFEAARESKATVGQIQIVNTSIFAMA